MSDVDAASTPIDPTEATAADLHFAADAGRAAAALCLLAAHGPDKHPAELILAGTDQLPEPIIALLLDCQRLAIGAARLLERKAEADGPVDWHVTSMLLMRMAQEATAAARERQ